MNPTADVIIKDSSAGIYDKLYFVITLSVTGTLTYVFNYVLHPLMLLPMISAFVLFAVGFWRLLSISPRISMLSTTSQGLVLKVGNQSIEHDWRLIEKVNVKFDRIEVFPKAGTPMILWLGGLYADWQKLDMLFEIISQRPENIMLEGVAPESGDHNDTGQPRHWVLTLPRASRTVSLFRSWLNTLSLGIVFVLGPHAVRYFQGGLSDSFVIVPNGFLILSQIGLMMLPTMMESGRSWPISEIDRSRTYLNFLVTFTDRDRKIAMAIGLLLTINILCYGVRIDDNEVRINRIIGSQSIPVSEIKSTSWSWDNWAELSIARKNGGLVVIPLMLQSDPKHSLTEIKDFLDRRIAEQKKKPVARQ